jgi:hypothetical protein
LDRLRDGLEPNGVDVQIEVPDHSVAWCPCIGCFGSLDYGVSTGTILGRRPIGTHHVDATSIDDKVPIDASPDLGVVFN